MKERVASFLIFIIGFFVSLSCTTKYPDQAQMNIVSGGDGCTTCHMNVDLLKLIATPQEHTGGDAGEG